MKEIKNIFLLFVFIPTFLFAQSPKDLIETGKAHLESGKLKLAHLSFVKAQKMNPSDYDAFYLDGVTLYRLANYNRSLGALKKARKINANAADLDFYTGMCYLKKRFKRTALIFFDNAIKRDSSRAEYFHSKGLALYRRKKYNDALKEFYTATLKSKPLRESFLYVGLSNNRMKKYTAAIDDFTTCIERYPDYGLAFFNRGILKIKVDDEVGACQDLDEAFKLNYQRANKKLNKYCR
jgi:tetratricopeptide (TPR) repeat protein